MNEEAMTPDKEQVVEPLSAEDFWRTHCNDCGHDLHPMNVCSAIVGGDQNGPDYCPCAIDYPALAAEYQRAARTASVAGLDRYYRAEPLGDDDDGWVVCRGANRVLVVADEAEASRVVSGLNADLFHAAPSIEQEPGEDLRTAATSVRDTLAAGHTPTVNQYDALNAALLREQEPGETLRAAASALRTIRDLCDMNLDEMNATFGSEQRVRIVVIPALVCEALGEHPITDGLRRVLFERFSYLGNPALEADRNPQETER